MATTNSSSVLRFSGMNSGLDTESIVNAMTAATKLKITKQNRKAITLKWKQEAYQGITTKLTDFQNKYLDMLNSKVNLKSKSTFTKYGATVSTLKAYSRRVLLPAYLYAQAQTQYQVHIK
jgi:flagellar hook-associated protein 2